jgi:hypothetical protein
MLEGKSQYGVGEDVGKKKKKVGVKRNNVTIGKESEVRYAGK